MATLDQYVDMDYSLVYFHHGLTSRLIKSPEIFTIAYFCIFQVFYLFSGTSLPCPGCGVSTKSSIEGFSH